MSVKNKIVEWLIRKELNKHAKEGTMLGKLWYWLDGKKTVVGSLIALISYIAAGVPLVSPLCGDSVPCLQHVTTAGGILLALVGLLHKAYKFIYKVDVSIDKE